MPPFEVFESDVTAKGKFKIGLDGLCVCNKCKIPKPTVEFVKSSHMSRGFASTCRACARVYYHDHKPPLIGRMGPEPKIRPDGLFECSRCHIPKPEGEFHRTKGKKRGFVYRCKECQKKYHASKTYIYYPKINELNQQTRLAVLQKLGGKCVKCNFSDKRALQIDHVNGDGHKHAKIRGTAQYHNMVMNDQTGQFQLLCANCNWIKKVENKEVRKPNKHKELS